MVFPLEFSGFRPPLTNDRLDKSEIVLKGQKCVSTFQLKKESHPDLGDFLFISCLISVSLSTTKSFTGFFSVAGKGPGLHSLSRKLGHLRNRKVQQTWQTQHREEPKPQW